MSEPVLWVSVGLGAPLGLLADSPLIAEGRAVVEGRCAALLKELGLPARPLVELRRLAAEEELLQVSVAGTRCRFPAEVPWLAWCYASGALLLENAEREFGEWVAGLPAAGDASGVFAEWLALSVVEIVTRHCGNLLTAETADLYLEPFAVSATDSVRCALAHVLDLRVSLANRELVAALLKENAGLDSEEKAEALLAVLRPEAIEVILPRPYFRQIVGPADRGAFGPLRDWIFDEAGIALPVIRFVESDGVKAESFRFRINSIATMPHRGLPPGSWMANEPPGPDEGLALLDPLNGTRRRLVTNSAWDASSSAWAWTPLRYLLWWLRAEIRDKAGCLVDREFLNGVETDFPALFHACEQLDSQARRTCVLRSLASERVSIRNVRGILDALVDYDIVRADPRLVALDDRLPCAPGPDTASVRDAARLTAFVRMRLRREICRSSLAGDRVLPVYLLDARLEDAVLAEAPEAQSAGQLSQPLRERLLEGVRRATGLREPLTIPAPLVTMGDVRPLVREAIADEFPRMAVLAYHELPPEIAVQSVGRVTADAERDAGVLSEATAAR